ncbi:hypothetical protein C8J57DRAFT_1252854 [Mycena rebaudengoi]|nr:hypothetical protein C8J57DRAFT_1252854 [Mycena rebaudengoi]
MTRPLTGRRNPLFNHRTAGAVPVATARRPVGYGNSLHRLERKHRKRQPLPTFLLQNMAAPEINNGVFIVRERRPHTMIVISALASFILSRNQYANGDLAMILGVWHFACKSHADVKRIGTSSWREWPASGILTSDGIPAVRIGNPVALIVSCEDRLFLAVAQVSEQILCLVPATLDDDPTQQNNRCWLFKLEAICMNILGNLIHPLKPSIVQACLIIEVDPASRAARESDVHNPSTCSNCTPAVSIDASNGKHVLEHMGGHVLFNAIPRDVQQCYAARQINGVRSACGNPIHLNMAAAAVAKESSLYKVPDKVPPVEYKTSATVTGIKGMRAKWDNHFKFLKHRNLKEKSQRSPLVISEAHSLRIALYYIIADSVRLKRDATAMAQTEGLDAN